MALWAIALFLQSLLMAGCLSGTDSGSNDLRPPEGLGSITGRVLTITLEPVPGATVRLIDGDKEVATVITAADGTYKFNGIGPGDYRLQVEAPCCRQDLRGVNVIPDEIASVDLQLVPYSSGDLQHPHVERHEWRGFLACSARFPNPQGPHHDLNLLGVPGSVSYVNVCAFAGNLTDDDFLHTFDVGPGLKTLVGAMQWRAPGASLGEELSIRTEVANRSNSPPLYTLQDGTSPLEFRVDAGAVIEEYDEEIDGENIHQFDFTNLQEPLTLQFRVFAGGEANVVYQQQFTVYWDLYYWEPAPAGTTALPDL